jgi:hypothetical protein
MHSTQRREDAKEPKEKELIQSNRAIDQQREIATAYAFPHCLSFTQSSVLSPQSFSSLLLCLSVALCYVFLSACIPAKEPPNLDDTPGPPVVITGDWVEVGGIRARYPDGWRVITSPADTPPFVIFASPDNCALIVLSVEPMDVPQPASDCEQTDFQTMTHETTLFAGLSAPAASFERYRTTFEAVMTSLETEP